MMNIFDPRYKLPDRHQTKKMVINKFDSCRKNVIYDLQKIPGKVFFTADMWTLTLSSEAYLSLIIHYIDQNWILQHFLLDIIPFKTRHTGINMVTEITKVLDEFKLVGKAMAITTDNESAMLEILDVQKLIAKIKNSVLLCDDLCELCIIEKLKYLQPEIDVETKWNSTYYMLYKLQQMETALKMLIIKHEGVCNLMPNAKVWNKIRDTIIVLELLERATKSFSSSMYPTIANVRFYFGDQTSQVDEETTQTPASSNTDFAEIERYLALPCDENVEALLWWQAHSSEFPVLSLMAKDYLAIQSTNIACEQVFYVAGNTITKT
ncbi:zinc finger BED domain-containing protein RICESLEEPER 2-like [Rhizophagus clarus]|uniref:Zinc finger BED domain-containing protein RICESLEEPER 2-like n=1 Tax=Rhizophagus clarus TaxID=94130 RepID=A0A8H3KXI9_9GLOM|nr:zinc finger BED domain-containing protein RICESLEEPER 2-like [Rhizophagus clarus]